MPERARVTSLEAIENFRAVLVVYREKAARVLDEAADNVVRTRLWLQTNRIEHWKNEVRRCELELKQRQQELFGARLSSLSTSSFVQQAAVQKAQDALREADAKLQTVKQWNRQFDQRVEPLAKQVEKFRHDVSQDSGKAVAWLSELNKTLSAYAELSPTSGSGPPPSETAPAEEDAQP